MSTRIRGQSYGSLSNGRFANDLPAKDGQKVGLVGNKELDLMFVIMIPAFG